MPRLYTSQSTFYESVAKELIKNEHSVISRRSAHAPKYTQILNNELVAGVGAHLAVRNKKRKLSNGDVSSATLQRSCRICKVNKSNFLCSTCRENGAGNINICYVSTKRCFLSTRLLESYYLEVM